MQEDKNKIKKICSISFFVNEEGTISSQTNFDIGFFNGNREIANSILEGLHYDFLHRMNLEKLVNYEIKLNS
jgi:hypothetical protein